MKADTKIFMVISRSGDRDGLKEALADSMYQAKLDLSAHVIRLVSKDIMHDNQLLNLFCVEMENKTIAGKI